MSAPQRPSLRLLLLQRINLIRKPKDLLAVHDEDEIQNSQDVGSREAGRRESLFTAVEEGLSGRILSDLLVGQVDELVVKRHRERLAAERSNVKAREELA